MKTRIGLAAILLVMALIPGCVFMSSPPEEYAANDTSPQRYPQCSPPPTGDWRMEGNVMCANKEMALSGNLIVAGSMVLDNVTLIMNSREDGQYWINVSNEGELRVHRSKITSSDPNSGYRFYYLKGSEGSIDLSVIERMSNGGDIIGSGGEGAAAGLNILTDGFVLANSIIRYSKGRGAVISLAKDAVILNNTFYGNHLDGVRAYNSSDITIANNTGYGNGEYAIKAMQSKNVTIMNNTAINNARDGIHILASEDIRITDNVIRHNGWNGIKVGAGHGSRSRLILIEGNVIENSSQYGIRLIESDQSTIRNNVIRGNNNSGVMMDWYADGNVIEGNTFDVNRQNGIMVQNASNAIIRSNKVTNNGEHGIIVQWTGGDNLIGGNTVVHNKRNGIDIYNSSNVMVKANDVRDNGDGAINVGTASANITILNNTIKNHGFNGDRSSVYIYLSDVKLNDNEIDNSTGHGIHLKYSFGSIYGNKVTNSRGVDVALENSTVQSNSPFVDILATKVSEQAAKRDGAMGTSPT